LNFSEGGLGRMGLRFAAPFTKLRRFPVIGPGLRWASAKLIPRDVMTWVQVQHGPAQESGSISIPARAAIISMVMSSRKYKTCCANICVRE
jgi:hypothetical protein